MMPVWVVVTKAEVSEILPVPETFNPVAALLLVQLNTVPVTLPLNTAAMGVPAQIFRSGTGLTDGAAATCTVNVRAGPLQLPNRGVTVMVAVCGPPGAAAVKFKAFPVPVAARPIFGLLFVQLKAAPAVPEKATETDSPTQRLILANTLMVGMGCTVTEKVTEGPWHPFSLGNTVITLVPAIVTLAAVAVSVLPEFPAVIPVAVLLFDQVKEAVLGENGIEMTVPPQTVRLAGGFMAGGGLIKISKVRVGPVHPLAVAVTETTANSATPAGACAIKLILLPLPAGIKPMAGLLFSQFSVAPGILPRLIATFCPAQRVTLGN